MPATSGRKTANPPVGFFVSGDYATGSTVKIARTSCSTSSACGKSSIAMTRNCLLRPTVITSPTDHSGRRSRAPRDRAADRQAALARSEASELDTDTDPIRSSPDYFPSAACERRWVARFGGQRLRPRRNGLSTSGLLSFCPSPRRPRSRPPNSFRVPNPLGQAPRRPAPSAGSGTCADACAPPSKNSFAGSFPSSSPKR